MSPWAEELLSRALAVLLASAAVWLGLLLSRARRRGTTSRNNKHD